MDVRIRRVSAIAMTLDRIIGMDVHIRRVSATTITFNTLLPGMCV